MKLFPSTNYDSKYTKPHEKHIRSETVFLKWHYITDVIVHVSLCNSISFVKLNARNGLNIFIRSNILKCSGDIRNNMKTSLQLILNAKEIIAERSIRRIKTFDKICLSL